MLYAFLGMDGFRMISIPQGFSSEFVNLTEVFFELFLHKVEDCYHYFDDAFD
jgi:dTDP-4-dehydrorhamnose 3,5-epimerase-like enzyme